jgi:ADP-ribose pyrophosphatase
MGPELRERLITSQTAFAGRLISVRVDQVELPDGRRAHREVVAHPGAAAVAARLPDGRVVMIRQYRHAAGRVLWELPAGTLGPGESPEQCARRELMEEAGYEVGKLRLLFSTYLSPGYSSEIIHIFEASELRSAGPALEGDERVEVVAMPLEEALELVERGDVQNAAAICGLLAVARWGGGAEGGIE